MRTATLQRDLGYTSLSPRSSFATRTFHVPAVIDRVGCQRHLLRDRCECCVAGPALDSWTVVGWTGASMGLRGWRCQV